MANVSLGDKGCSIGGVAIALKKSPDCVLLSDTIVEFTHRLKTCPIKAKFAKEKLENNASSFVEVTTDILTDWRSRDPSSCTLQNLYDILCSCQLVSLAEHLRNEYSKFEIVPTQALQSQKENKADAESNLVQAYPAAFRIPPKSHTTVHQTNIVVLSHNPNETASALLNALNIEQTPSIKCSKQDYNYPPVLDCPQNLSFPTEEEPCVQKSTFCEPPKPPPTILHERPGLIYTEEVKLSHNTQSKFSQAQNASTENSEAKIEEPLSCNHPIENEQTNHTYNGLHQTGLGKLDEKLYFEFSQKAQNTDYDVTAKESQALSIIQFVKYYVLAILCSVFSIFVAITWLTTFSIMYSTHSPINSTDYLTTETLTTKTLPTNPPITGNPATDNPITEIQRTATLTGRHLDPANRSAKLTTIQKVTYFTTTDPALHILVNLTVKSYWEYQHQIFGVNKKRQVSLTITSTNYSNWLVDQYLTNTYLIAHLKIQGYISISAMQMILIQMPNIKELSFENFDNGAMCNERKFHPNKCSIRLPVLKTLAVKNFSNCEHVMEFISECISAEELQYLRYNREINDQTVLQIHNILSKANTTIEHVEIRGTYDTEINLFGTSLLSKLLYVKTIVLEFTRVDNNHEAIAIIDSQFCKKFKGLQKFTLINGLINTAQFIHLLACNEILEIETGLVIEDPEEMLQLEKLPPFVMSLKLNIFTKNFQICSKFNSIRMRDYWFANLEIVEICLICVSADNLKHSICQL